MNHPQTIYQLIKRSSELYPNYAAFTLITKLDPEFCHTEVSYRQFFSDVKRAGRMFSEVSEKKADVVVSTLLPNIPQHHVALWGAECIGIANPLNPLLSVGAITELILKADSDILISVGPTPGIDIWEKAKKAVADVERQAGKKIKLFAVSLLPPTLKMMLRLINAPLPSVVKSESVRNDFDRALRCYSDDELDATLLNRNQDVVAYFHTGGTTGTPKLAKHTALNQLTSASRVCSNSDFQPGEKVLNGLPLFHVAGAIVTSLGALLSGMNIVLPTIKVSVILTS
ncbi:AMP-binding protein [Bacterioplanoides sp.]|uniref:AMP-binding protein n=1 Tax=Bacterioplanoides sp. TaxID=2066072 RepID=UPI003B5CFA58